MATKSATAAMSAPRRALRAFALAVPAMLPALAWGQASAFRDGGLIHAIPARRFVAQADDRVVAGGDFALVRRQTAEAQAFATHSVTAHVFALDPAGDSRVPAWWAQFAPCQVYLATMLTLPIEADGSMVIRVAGGESWLTVDGGRVVPGRFLIVFDDRPTPPDDEFLRLAGGKVDTVRLDAGAAAAYFDQGLVFTVTPSREYSADEARALAATILSNAAHFAQAASRNVAILRCYKPRAIADAHGETISVALADGCADDTPTP